MGSKVLNPEFVAAHLWQSRRWPDLLPVQPGSKILLRGYGPYLERINTGEKIAYYFQDRKCNLAVIAPDCGVILDFDDFGVYVDFTKRWPQLATSYTESTPSGGGRHLFLWSTSKVESGLVLVPGIEVKKFCVVYPSQVEGRFYKVAVPGPILTGDVLEALQPFKAPALDKCPSSRTVTISGRPVSQKRQKIHGVGFVDQLKGSWPIQLYLAYFEPELVLRGKGRWLTGVCPWHDDHHPSLWVDTERGTWGCHGCQAHGDVLNWHMLRLGTGLSAALLDLARYKVEVQHV